MKKSSILILSYSLFFSLLCGYGVLGYGVDFHEGYRVGNYTYGTLFDRAGFAISVLQFNGLWLGAFISSILQFLVYSKILFIRFGFTNSIYKLVLIILLSFSWSHLLSSLNMVRQSIAINIFYLVALSYSFKFNILYLLLGPFLHKISPIFWLAKQTNSFKLLNKKIFKLISFFIIVILIPIYLNFVNYSSNYVVGFDLTYISLFIVLFYLMILLIKRKCVPDNIFFICTILSSVHIGFIISGSSQIAERIFVSYFGFLILSLIFIFRNTFTFRKSMIFLLSLYVIISWTIGPLQDGIYK